MNSHIEITCKEFETYLRVKEFIERNNYEEDNLNATFRFKMRGPIPLIIRSDDMEPTRYEFLTDTAKDIGVSKQTLIYAHKNKRPLITKRKIGIKVFSIEWLDSC